MTTAHRPASSSPLGNLPAAGGSWTSLASLAGRALPHRRGLPCTRISQEMRVTVASRLKRRLVDSVWRNTAICWRLVLVSAQ
ncbi:hypothetical protein BDZ90DRAFT_173018 [Jaminaea rosea]|uniref:Uncharacterized protein n=1 Tax=Jaminaea rosea TaxID=1569628 RepID=A0A316USR4_9BASI|nr:hypothetical protein BDZ90DRAFT_173018 [Jaminaea rosea]PWN27828.1 hypothetical protein BDZ90DRAFT_173018 [Jaminaea rosea]